MSLLFHPPPPSILLKLWMPSLEQRSLLSSSYKITLLFFHLQFWTCEILNSTLFFLLSCWTDTCMYYTHGRIMGKKSHFLIYFKPNVLITWDSPHCSSHWMPSMDELPGDTWVEVMGWRLLVELLEAHSLGLLLVVPTQLPRAGVWLEQCSWPGQGCAVGSSRYSNKNVSTLKCLYGFNYSVVFFKNKTKNKTNL